jgi:uncharacterized protein YegL
MAKKVIKKTIITEEVNSGDKTLIVCILDRSGSMSSVIDDAIGGFNEFLKKQKKLDDDATMTVALFDDRYELLYNNVDLQKVEKMTRAEWSPRGLTRLYDAIGKTINDVDSELKKLKKKNRPDKIIVAIVTDGFENDSREYSQSDIQKLIKQKKKADWQFVYLAADQDAFEAGTSVGISGGNTFAYTNTSTGNKVMFDSLSNATKLYRSAVKGSANYAAVTNSLFSENDGNETITLDGGVTFTTTADGTDAEDEEGNS